MTEFYYLSHNTPKRKKWAYLSNLQNLESVPCRKCQSILTTIKGELTAELDGGKQLPDIIQCGSFPYLIVSNKVVDIWNKNDIKGFNVFTEVILKNNPQPDFHYYLLDIVGNCELNLDEMDFDIISECSICSTPKFNKESWQIRKVAIKKISPKGTDLFCSKYFPHVVFCSEKVIQIAGKFKLTNFLFMDGKKSFDLMNPPQEIDYLHFLINN